MPRTRITAPAGITPASDHGFFGPDSVTWKVWSFPTSIVLGFLRSVVVEELDPFLVASVADSGQVKARPRLRYDRTVQYFATVAFGDAASVLAASDILMKIHARSVGPEPVTGGTYDANDPDSQLWIHLTAWHSLLYTYEMFGPGRLSAADEARYWDECALAAEFQTIDPTTVPRTREGVRAYFEDYRAQLVGSPVARDMMEFLLRAQTDVLPAWVPRPLRAGLTAVVRRGVVATMPHWMRDMGGMPQSRATDLAAAALIRPVAVAVSLSPRLQLALLRVISPRTVPVVAPVLLGVPPTDPRVREPAEARAAYGHTSPREQYAELEAARARHEGPRPYPRDHRESLVEFSASR